MAVLYKYGEGEKDGAQLLKAQKNGDHVMTLTPRGVSGEAENGSDYNYRTK